MKNKALLVFLLLFLIKNSFSSDYYCQGMLYKDLDNPPCGTNASYFNSSKIFVWLDGDTYNKTGLDHLGTYKSTGVIRSAKSPTNFFQYMPNLTTNSASYYGNAYESLILGSASLRIRNSYAISASSILLESTIDYATYYQEVYNYTGNHSIDYMRIYQKINSGANSFKEWWTIHCNETYSGPVTLTYGFQQTSAYYRGWHWCPGHYGPELWSSGSRICNTSLMDRRFVAFWNNSADGSHNIVYIISWDDNDSAPDVFADYGSGGGIYLIRPRWTRTCTPNETIILPPIYHRSYYIPDYNSSDLDLDGVPDQIMELIDSYYPMQHACGDDDASIDTFYNGTIGLTKNFCHEAQFINDKIDRKQNLCEYYGYNWMLGNTTDGSYDDDFENYAENDDILTLDDNWNYFIYGPSTDLNFTAYNESGDIVGRFYDNNADASMLVFREIEPNGKLGEYISFDLKVITPGSAATYIALMDPSGNAVGILGLMGGNYVGVNNTNAIPLEATGNWDKIEMHSVPYDEGQDPWSDPGRWKVKINDNWYPSETSYYEGYGGRYWASEEIGSMLLGTDAFGTPAETAEILIDDLKTSWLNEINYSCCGDDYLYDNFYNETLINSAKNFCHKGGLLFQTLDYNKSLCEYYGYSWIDYGIVESFSPYQDNELIRNKNGWNSWTIADDVNFTKSTLEDDYWGFLNDSSALNNINPIYVFSQSKTWNSTDDWFEITVKRLSGTDNRPLFGLSRSGTWLVPLYLYDYKITGIDNITMKNIATSLTNGSDWKIRISYASDTSSIVTVWENGTYKSNLTLTNYQGALWSQGAINWFVLDTGASTISQQYFKGITASWLNGSAGYMKGPDACCGDDSESDTFYKGNLESSNQFCINGEYFNQSLDDNQTLCEYYNYTWIDGVVSGNNGACCGDDELNDNFYNDSISNTTHFCFQGQVINREIDSNKTLCEYYNYSWINNSVSSIDYSFTSELNGTTDPEGWVCWGSADPGHCYVVNSAEGKSKVMELFDNDAIPDADKGFSNVFPEKDKASKGVMSYYFMMKDPDGPDDAFFLTELLRATGGVIVLASGKITAFGLNSQLACIENLATGLTVVGSIQPNTWHKVQIIFDNSLSTVDIKLDDNSAVTCGLYDSWQDLPLANVLFLSGGMLASGTPDHYVWVDDIYFDWLHNMNCCGDDGAIESFYNVSHSCIKGSECFDEINLGEDDIFGTSDDSCGCQNDGTNCLFSGDYFSAKGTCYYASCSSMEQFLPADFSVSRIEYSNLYSNSVSEIKVYVKNNGNGTGTINSVNVSGLSVTSISYEPVISANQEELITIKAFAPCSVEGIVNNFNFTINYYDGASKNLESSNYEILTANPLSISFVSSHLENSFLRLMIDSEERIQYFIENNGLSSINFSATINHPDNLFSRIKTYSGEYYYSEINEMTFNIDGNSRFFFSNQLYPIISGSSGQYSKIIQDLNCEHNKIILAYNYEIVSESGSGINVMVADESINIILAIIGLLLILDSFLIKKNPNF